MKKFIVTWVEKHSIVIEAENEATAINRVNEGYGSDDAVSIDGEMKAEVLKV